VERLDPSEDIVTTASRTIDTPVGVLRTTANEDGLRTIFWLREAANVADVPEVPRGSHRVLDALQQQLDEYFRGERLEFDLPLAPAGTPFQLAAWQVLRQIPYGATMTYGEQARRLGDPRKARAVGAANGRNPLSIVVPCHRVVGANGHLTGFGGGIENKAWLLDHEQRTLATR
jgi:methylated-DNA-[protein]-cysteine S-methyltransferase